MQLFCGRAGPQQSTLPLVELCMIHVEATFCCGLAVYIGLADENRFRLSIGGCNKRTHVALCGP